MENLAGMKNKNMSYNFFHVTSSLVMSSKHHYAKTIKNSRKLMSGILS